MGSGQKILNEYIKYGLLEKYRDQAIVIKQLDEYMKTGDTGLITRDNGLRDAFKQYLNKDMVASITQGNIENYVIYYMDYLSQTLNSNKEAVEQKEQIREQMIGECRKLYNVSGKHMLAGALSTSLSGNFNMFIDPGKMMSLASKFSMRDFILSVTSGHVTNLADNWGMQAAEILSQQFNREISDAKAEVFREQDQGSSQRR
jgi:hypothetical protein